MPKKIANQTVVDETATFIAAELKALLDRGDYKSHMSRRLSEACPTYSKLTNAESVLAMIKALNLATLDVIGDLASLTYGSVFDEEETPDDDIAA